MGHFNLKYLKAQEYIRLILVQIEKNVIKWFMEYGNIQ